MTKPTVKPGAFDEAIDWFRERLPLTDKQARGLEQRSAKRAFRVAGVTQVRVVDSVFKGIDRALRNGTTLEDFKREVGGQLREQWQGTVANPTARMGTIFRTNLQHAYSAGRVRELRSADTMAVRPFWMFSALMDLRTTDICKSCNGVITQADSGWVKLHTPPLHFNCRSTLLSLTAERSAKMGGVTRHPPQEHPPNGFGNIEDRHEEPEPKDLDPELRQLWRAKVLAHGKPKSK